LAFGGAILEKTVLNFHEIPKKNPKTVCNFVAISDVYFANSQMSNVNQSKQQLDICEQIKHFCTEILIRD